jgi:multidrug efflux system membrane fusion protein
VQQRDIKVTLSAIGNMAALNTAVVRAKVDGELKAIRFKEGQQVTAGQLLAEVDARAFESQLAQVQGQLVRDQAQLRNAQIDLERYKDLLAKDSIAKQQVDTQDALVKQLQGTVQTDQAQVDTAKLNLSYTKVTAPISGRLGLKQADLGSIVRASDANGLVTITQTQPISLVFAVPEANLLQISRQLKGKDPVGVEVWDRDQRQRLGQGKVITTDNAIDAATGTIKLKAEFPNKDGSLFPNQFVNVRLLVETLVGATAIPTNAIQRGAQGTFVYVVKDDSTVSMRRLKLGTTDGDWVSVQGEIAPGDKVVTDGADRLREGAKVEVITPPPRFGGGGGFGGGAGRPGAGGAAAPAAPGAAAPESGKPGGDRPAKPGQPGAAPGANAGPDRPAGGPPPAGGRPAGGPPPGGPGPGGPGGPGGLPPRADGLPPWFDRMPPEMQEKFKAMNPEQRQEFIEKARERRRQREAEGG